MKIKTFLIGLFVASSTFAADSVLNKEALLASAPSLCVQAASENYDIAPKDIQQKGQKVRYSTGLKGALLVLEIGGIGKRTCIAKRTGKVSFTRRTGLR